MGEAADGPTAERLIREREPVLALLDLRMPGRDGLEVLARLRHFEPPVAVVVLTSYTDAALVHSAMDAGAAAYVAKDSDRHEILEVLVDAALGRRRVVTEAHEADAPRPRLSARERTVLAMLNRGWSVEEISMLASMSRGPWRRTSRAPAASSPPSRPPTQSPRPRRGVRSAFPRHPEDRRSAREREAERAPAAVGGSTRCARHAPR